MTIAQSKWGVTSHIVPRLQLGIGRGPDGYVADENDDDDDGYSILLDTQPEHEQNKSHIAMPLSDLCKAKGGALDPRSVD